MRRPTTRPSSPRATWWLTISKSCWTSQISTVISRTPSATSALTLSSTPRTTAWSASQVLDALQELSRLVVMTETGHRSRLTLDIGGFRERRRLELVALAKDAVAEVLENGEPVRMAPLNAYERKIIHDEVAAAGLTSESEGEPPFRRVVVSKP